MPLCAVSLPMIFLVLRFGDSLESLVIRLILDSLHLYLHFTLILDCRLVTRLQSSCWVSIDSGWGLHCKALARGASVTRYGGCIGSAVVLC